GGAELSALNFLTSLDVDTDVDTFCTQLETAVSSAVYLPAFVGGTLHSVDGVAQACMQATAQAATRLLWFAFRARRNALDRIATRQLTPTQKGAVVDRTMASIGSARDVLAQRLDSQCPNFMVLYGQTAASFLTLIAQRADCLSGATYPQAAVV